MWRTLAALIGLFSFATILAEAMTLGYLAYDGRLSSERISALLSDQPLASEATESVEETPLPTAEEAENERTLRTLELNARADNLQLLKDLLTKEADKLSKDRTAYEKARQDFEAELELVRTRATEEATEQARLVVKSLAPRDAITYLLSLE